MSRRDDQSDIYRRPRRDRHYDDELEVDITRQRYPERRAETAVKERESVVTRGPRQPDFLREDYGQTSAGQLVLRQEDRDEEVIYRSSPAPPRSRAPPERVEKVIYEERERAPPYPRSQRSDVGDREEVIYRERTRSRSRAPPPPSRQELEEVDIHIHERERARSRPPPPRSPPRSEAPVEEIRFRRGGGPPRVVERTDVEIRREARSPSPPPPPAPLPPRTVIEREEVDIRERRSPPRGRDSYREEIRVRERSAPPPEQRSPSQGRLVARKDEEWVVRRPRPPPPRDYEKEEIIIRRRERTPEPEPEPEPVCEPEPEPVPEPEPAPEPKYLPPIIQEIITHHRHYDHPIERAPEEKKEVVKEVIKEEKKEEKKEEHFELEIRRKGTRNGKAYEEDFTFEKAWHEPSDDDVVTRRSHSIGARSTSRAPVRRRYDDEYEDEVAAEADFYNSKIASRAYPGEAYNGATKDWALVDVPPGTERVRMDGVGGGRQEITWQRYNGERRGRFVSGDRAYEAEFGSNGYAPPPPPPPQLPPAPAPPEPVREFEKEIRITKTRKEELPPPPPRKRDKMWTEVTKDLVIKEAIEEQGYEYEETEGHFYIIEYLRYEDVLRLVEITEDIKRERRERIREIQWERDEIERLPKMLPPPPPAPLPPRSKYDERIYERDYVYDRDVRRYR